MRDVYVIAVDPNAEPITNWYVRDATTHNLYGYVSLLEGKYISVNLDGRIYECASLYEARDVIANL